VNGISDFDNSVVVCLVSINSDIMICTFGL